MLRLILTIFFFLGFLSPASAHIAAYDLVNRMTKFAVKPMNTFGVHMAFTWQNFSFDNSGNPIREYNENNVTQRQYSYDMEGRLLQMTDPRRPGYRVNYTYDGLNRRLSSSVTDGGVTYTKRYVYCGMRMCQQRDLGVNSIRRYLETGEYVNALGAAPAQKLVYMPDHLGSVRDVVDADTGARVGALDYEPYGTTKRITGLSTDYRYAGLLWDGNIGQYLSTSRLYDPGTLRWLNRDWIRETGGINLYGYVSGNPISNIDPDGKAAVPIAVRSLPVIIGGAVAWWQNVVAPSLPGAVFNEEAKPDVEQKPQNCPTGTKPVDKDKRLNRPAIHGIKGQIGAGPKDWVGISPDGHIWTNEGGAAVDHGPYEDYLP